MEALLGRKAGCLSAQELQSREARKPNGLLGYDGTKWQGVLDRSRGGFRIGNKNDDFCNVMIGRVGTFL